MTTRHKQRDVDEVRQQIQKFIKKSADSEKIQSLALFGSYAKGEVKGDSDMDLLISFRRPVGYFTLARIQNELSQFLQREVDLVTVNSLSRYFREEVLDEAVSLYEK